MSEFAITAVSYNAAHTQIARCMLHTIEHVARRLVISEGRDVPYTDVSALIDQGKSVWVVLTLDDGTLHRVDRVVTLGHRGNLFSDKGDSLFGLSDYDPLP
jgi:hypothetical protein